MSLHQHSPAPDPAAISNPPTDLPLLNLANRDNRPSLKTINISFANVNKSINAFKELTLARSRDSIILVCETPTSDGIPPNLPGYYLLFDDSTPDSPPRVWAYVATKIIDLMERFTCSRDQVSVYLIDGWVVTASYSDPDSPIDAAFLTPINRRTIIFGDFNGKHSLWYPTRRSDCHRSLARGRQLYDWSRRSHTVERGHRLPTRHRDGDIPSKIDLIWTRRDADPFFIADYAPHVHSDHCIVAGRFRLIRPPATSSQPRPNYKRMSPDKFKEFFESWAPPTDAGQLDSLLQDALLLIPRITRHPNHKLLPDIRHQRSLVRLLMKRRWGSASYKEARKEYRESLKDFINRDIEDTLDDAHDPQFYRFTKKSTISRPVPTCTLNGQVYSGHARLAKCFADYHRAGPASKIHPVATPDIPPILPPEVSSALSLAPPSSASGHDQVSASLLNALHPAHPTCLSSIFTSVLRSGHHPASWKLATVVPIPKANKPTYTHPKSWRSIHLLSVVSKTLERIVLHRLQSTDDYTRSDRPVGPTQFGSRIRLGTSDAMQCYLRWKENAHSANHFTTLISANVEGGFDKVDPSRLSSTLLNPLYTNWICHWASDRGMKFRPNHRLDHRVYTSNQGIPQGSPLSPFLFGAYIKTLMDPRLIVSPDHSRLVISYVDDVLICISATSRSTVESLARTTWASLNSDAHNLGMSFAENKTKTLHDRIEDWGIGTTVNKLRFLGYWLETPPPISAPTPLPSNTTCITGRLRLTMH